MEGTNFSIKIDTRKNHKAYRDRTRFTLSLSVCATIKPGVACPRHLQGGDRRENACPPVAYFSDSIRVSPHVFRLADRFHLDRSIIWEKTDTHRAATKEAQTENSKKPPSFSPEKEGRVTAASQGGALSLLLPGSNCLFCSLNVLCLRFDGVAAIEEMPATVTVLVARSVLDEYFPFCLNLRPRSKRRWR